MLEYITPTYVFQYFPFPRFAITCLYYLYTNVYTFKNVQKKNVHILLFQLKIYFRTDVLN